MQCIVQYKLIFVIILGLKNSLSFYLYIWIQDNAERFLRKTPVRGIPDLQCTTHICFSDELLNATPSV